MEETEQPALHSTALRVNPEWFALDKVNDAFRQDAQGRAKGKTIIQLVSE